MDVFPALDVTTPLAPNIHRLVLCIGNKHLPQKDVGQKNVGQKDGAYLHGFHLIWVLGTRRRGGGRLPRDWYKVCHFSPWTAQKSKVANLVLVIL